MNALDFNLLAKIDNESVRAELRVDGYFFVRNLNGGVIDGIMSKAKIKKALSFFSNELSFSDIWNGLISLKVKCNHAAN